MNYSISSSEKWDKGLPNEEVLDEGPKKEKRPKLSQRESENSLQLETGTDRVKVHDDEFVMSGQHFNVK